MKLIGIVGGLDTARLHVQAAVSELLSEEARR